jgi:hypothetical protein
MVQGESYDIGERKLTPVAQIISFGKAKGTIGAKRIGGWGLGFTWIKPVALIEETAGEEHRIPIHHSTSDAVWRLVGVALAITLFFTTIRWLTRRLRTG